MERRGLGEVERHIPCCGSIRPGGEQLQWVRNLDSCEGGAAYHPGFARDKTPEVLDSAHGASFSIFLRISPEDQQLSDEHAGAGIGRGGGVPDPDEDPRSPRSPSFWAPDPLTVADDAPPVPTRPALPVFDDAARSADPAVCPFLRRDLGGTLVAPADVPGSEQTCIAIGSPRPQSLRQQELVCLRVAHADCPRYRRGALSADPGQGSRSMPAVPRATLAALLVLVLSAGISFGFVVQRGGIGMPIVGGGASATPATSQVAAVASPSAGATDAPLSSASPSTTVSPGESAGVSASGEPSAEPTTAPTDQPSVEPSPGDSPSAEPTAEPTVAPTATVGPAATPRSDRYKLLKPCPDKAGCWIYTVRSGDNLYSIGKYFGQTLSTIYKWNPQYPGTALKVGAKIRMPAPTK
jgi:LysM repeat protein